MKFDQVMRELDAAGNPDAVAGMARFGIAPRNALGVSTIKLRELARSVGKDHELAAQLWASDVHEARDLACLVEDPARVDEAQLERWVSELYSWDICDQCCSNLFDRTPFAYAKAEEWSARDEEFVRRAGFVLMAALSVHDKQAGDQPFVKFLGLIAKRATDERNFVKKAVNWALRAIGKRNLRLNARAIRTAHKLRSQDSRAARWIAADALRELTSQAVQGRLRARQGAGRAVRPRVTSRTRVRR